MIRICAWFVPAVVFFFFDELSFGLVDHALDRIIFDLDSELSTFIH